MLDKILSEAIDRVIETCSTAAFMRAVRDALDLVEAEVYPVEHVLSRLYAAGKQAGLDKESVNWHIELVNRVR